MTFGTSHSSQNWILCLALMASLTVHAMFVVLAAKPKDVFQSGSSSRMSVSVSLSKKAEAERKTTLSEKTVQPVKTLGNHSALAATLELKKEVKPTTSSPKRKLVTVLASPELRNINLSQNQNQNKIVKDIAKTVPVNAPEKTLRLEARLQVSEKSTPVPATQNRLAEKTDPDAYAETKVSEVPRFQLGSLNNPKPKYPRLAAKRGWQGEVVLGVHVRPDGTIEHLTFVKSTHYGVLNYEAYETVRTSWQFEPLEDIDDQAESAYIEVPIRFNIATR